MARLQRAAVSPRALSSAAYSITPRAEAMPSRRQDTIDRTVAEADDVLQFGHDHPPRWALRSTRLGVSESYSCHRATSSVGGSGSVGTIGGRRLA